MASSSLLESISRFQHELSLSQSRLPVEASSSWRPQNTLRTAAGVHLCASNQNQLHQSRQTRRRRYLSSGIDKIAAKIAGSSQAPLLAHQQLLPLELARSPESSRGMLHGLSSVAQYLAIEMLFVFDGSVRRGVRVVMELRLGSPKQNPQWRCLVGSSPTLVNIFLHF